MLRQLRILKIYLLSCFRVWLSPPYILLQLLNPNCQRMLSEIRAFLFHLLFLMLIFFRLVNTFEEKRMKKSLPSQLADAAVSHTEFLVFATKVEP